MARSLLQKHVSRTLIIVVVAAAILAIAGVIAYSYRHTPKTITITTKATGTTSSSHSGAGAAALNDSSTKTSGTTSSSGQTANNPTVPQTGSTTLAQPTQTFNKSHTPISLSQTDSTQPDYPSLDSTCQAPIGATCEIHAVNGSTDILVAGPAAITAPTDGVDLPWNAKTKGLTAGTWQIIAVAKQSGQTSSSAAVTLTVTP